MYFFLLNEFWYSVSLELAHYKLSNLLAKTYSYISLLTCLCLKNLKDIPLFLVLVIIFILSLPYSSPFHPHTLLYFRYCGLLTVSIFLVFLKNNFFLCSFDVLQIINFISYHYYFLYSEHLEDFGLAKKSVWFFFSIRHIFHFHQ